MIEFLAGIAKRVSTLAADYTTARAAKLDNLDAAISAISVIKSVSYHVVTMNAVGSITEPINPAVDPGKSVLIHLGTEVNSSAFNTTSQFVRITLQSGTVVALNRNSTNGTVIVNFCLVEFK